MKTINSSAFWFSFGLVGAAIFFDDRPGVVMFGFLVGFSSGCSLLFAFVSVMGDVPKPGEATVATVAAPETDSCSARGSGRCRCYLPFGKRRAHNGTEFSRAVVGCCCSHTNSSPQYYAVRGRRTGSNNRGRIAHLLRDSPTDIQAFVYTYNIYILLLTWYLVYYFLFYSYNSLSKCPALAWHPGLTQI